jgi:hypothetical protein
LPFLATRPSILPTRLGRSSRLGDRSSPVHLAIYQRNPSPAVLLPRTSITRDLKPLALSLSDPTRMTALKVSRPRLLVTKSQEDWLTTPANALRHRGKGSTEATGGQEAPIARTLIERAVWLAGAVRRHRFGGPPSGQLPVSPASTSITAAAEWPVVGQLKTLATPPRPGEPAAFQVLRRLPAAHIAIQALAVVPSLGAGQPLLPSVRRPLETVMRRDLTQVRVHTAPVAAMLGAEAFTTGRHVVFAPGRLDVRSARGLALLGHELAHVGQTLAFKRSPGADLARDDAEERQARQQEDTVRHIIKHGWPAEPRMQVRRMASTHNPEISGSRTQPPESTAPERKLRSERSIAAESDSLPFARLREVTAPSRPSMPSETEPPDLGGLAHQVYALLKSRLRAERDRHQLYRR